VIKPAHVPVWNPPNQPHMTKVGSVPFLCLFGWTRDVSEPAQVIPADDWRNWRRCALADTLLHNARIRTMDPGRPHADWMLMREGRIAALGQGSRPTAEPDRRGRAAGAAGFQDAHIHLLSGGIDLATAAQLYDVRRWMN
jgi:hypothetical protein